MVCDKCGQDHLGNAACPVNEGTGLPSLVQFKMTDAFSARLHRRELHSVLGSSARTIAAFVKEQREFSENTFGPGYRTEGVTAHIASELDEIRRAPTDLMEWIDVVILALDGAWRAGHSPEAIEAALFDKLDTNKNRNWPDWRTAGDGAISHIKDEAD